MSFISGSATVDKLKRYWCQIGFVVEPTRLPPTLPSRRALPVAFDMGPFVGLTGCSRSHDAAIITTRLNVCFFDR